MIAASTRLCGRQRGRQGTAPIAKTAKDLGISESCLRNRLAQVDADESGNSLKATTAEKKEIAELRRKSRQLEMETTS